MSLLLALLTPPAPATYDLWDEQDLMVEYVDDAADLDAAQLIVDSFAAGGGDALDILTDEQPVDEDLVATFNEDEPHGELIVDDEQLEELELTLELRVTEDDTVAAASDDLEDEEPPQLAADGALPEQPAAPATDAELLAMESDELDDLIDADDPADRSVDDAETPADPSGDAEHDELAVPGALPLQVDDAAVVASDAELTASNDELEEPDEMTDSLDTQLVDAAAFIADNAELLALIDLEEAEIWDLELLAETHPDTLIALVLRLRTLMGVGQ